MRLFAIVPLLLCGCVSSAPLAEHDPVQTVIRQCGLEGQISFKRAGPDQYTYEGATEAVTSEGFMCVMKGLQARKLKIGFIANRNDL